MIPQLGQLPGLWRLAAKVSDVLSVPKIVIISFPSANLAERWTDLIFPTILEYLRIQEDVEESIELHLDETDREPLQLLSAELDCSIDKVEDFLYTTHGEPIVTLHWMENQELPSCWVRFLRLVLSAIEQSDQTRRFRKLLILDKGNSEFPEFLRGNPSVERLQLWNALTWEELRLLASATLRDEPNEIRRSWMISTYCGASNFDIHVLLHLCEKRPMSIDNTIKESQKILGTDPDPIRAPNSLLDGEFGREWHPPASAMDAWQAGSIVGTTIERGCVRPWNTHTRSERSTLPLHFIWKEQVSGLFPLLIELGRELNDKILERYANGLVGRVSPVAEPAAMLAALRDAGVWLPQNLFDAMTKLRDARNDLAHLRPLERRALEAIWDRQLRIRSGQY